MAFRRRRTRSRVRRRGGIRRRRLTGRMRY
jgi:hypothetical protein